MSMTEIRANRAYNTEGTPGFYVVNPTTRLAVAGPYLTEFEAAREARRRNSTPPLAPDPLEVVEIFDAA